MPGALMPIWRHVESFVEANPVLSLFAAHNVVEWRRTGKDRPGAQHGSTPDDRAFVHAAIAADQDVVLTVPASFDEVARELTVEAARRAGLHIDQAQLTLVEEPQAAFYHWLAEHARLGEEVEAGELIFV